MEYLSGVLSSMISPLFIVFVIMSVGYAIGGVKVKGISLGTAGVLLVAILAGVIFSFVPSFTIGGETIEFFGNSTQKVYKTVQSIGTLLFVTSVGLIAGPKFFRSMNKSMIAYIVMGVAIVLVGVGTTILLAWLDPNMDIDMATGLLAGSLTSTPAFSAAGEAAGKIWGEAADIHQANISTGYGLAYIYGVLGVVLFVQLLPRILKVDIEKEREGFVSANKLEIKGYEGKLLKMEKFGFFPFFITVFLGIIIGSIEIGFFSLGSSGGTLVAGLIVGHFGRFGKLDMKVSKETLKFFQELGLALFLVGAGIPGGIKFLAAFRWIYILYGIIMATLPMILGFVLGKYVFKLSIFNNLGSITGGMTSTPALGALISTAGTDDVASAYAATYPFALALIVISCNLMVMLPF